MTLLHDAIKDKKLDTRVVERNIDRGAVRSEDYDQALKELPDDSANAEYLNIEEFSNKDSSSRQASAGGNSYSSH